MIESIIITFNKPYLSGNDVKYIGEAVAVGKILGDGILNNVIN